MACKQQELILSSHTLVGENPMMPNTSSPRRRHYLLLKNTLIIISLLKKYITVNNK